MGESELIKKAGESSVRPKHLCQLLSVFHYITVLITGKLTKSINHFEEFRCFADANVAAWIVWTNRRVMSRKANQNLGELEKMETGDD